MEKHDSVGDHIAALTGLAKLTAVGTIIFSPILLFLFLA